MKEIKELKFEELSVEQKLGMIHAAMINGKCSDEAIEFVRDRIKNHALGAVWIQFSQTDADKMMKMVHETADYPILIITDAESGLGEFTIGRHNPIGCTGDEKYAYAFGKTVGFTARSMGYNVVCNPILDLKDNGWVRSYGADKHMVARMAAAEARGMHDGGVLTVGKHYPSGMNPKDIDSHMAESYSEQTREELLEQGLYAYRELMKEDLLDGVMTAHERFAKIDPDAPASLSKKVIDIIHDEGFRGFCITDALEMMGILSNFGAVDSKGLAIAAGNDLALPFTTRTEENQAVLDDCYRRGIISDERLDDAVKTILAAQHKVMLLEETRCRALTEEEISLSKNINRDSIYAEADEGLTPTVSRDGRHLFAIMVRNEERIHGGEVEVDTFSNGWLYPNKVVEKLKSLFPNSKVELFHQFPSQGQNWRLFHNMVDCDDVVFLTFSEPLAYVGREHLTQRIVTVIEAMQYTNRISALVHFGNPCVLEALPHIPRYVIGGISEESVDACLDVLAGEYPAKGVKTYDFKLN